MKLWLDVDDLFYFAARSSRPTGIQRLTGETYQALVALYPEKIGFLRHHASSDDFSIVEARTVLETYHRLRALTGSPPADPAPSVPTVRAKPSLLSRLTRRRVRRPAEPLVQPPAEVLLSSVGSRDDVLVALGAPWHDADYGKRLRNSLDRTGMRFMLLVHDLIPLLKPEFFEAGRAPHFENFMREALPLADGIMTNSRSTAADVRRWTVAQGIPLKATPAAVPIGTGFGSAPAGSLPEDLEPGQFVLFVSTIEVRKNHLQAFRVWSRLLESMPAHRVPTLVFAGGRGWMVDDLMKAIESTGGLGGKLRIVSNPEDACLSALYRYCMFTLFLSYYEGWGLPVSDSLSFGKICVASNRTSMPEAGGEHCLYVDPDNTSGAYESIRRLIESPQCVTDMEQHLALTFKPVPWSATAEAVVERSQNLDRVALEEVTINVSK